MPIFSFGENDIYDQVENSPGTWLRWFQDGLQRVTRGSILLVYGSFGLMPYRRPITTVGEPRPGLRAGKGLQSKRWAYAAREYGHRPVHT